MQDNTIESFHGAGLPSTEQLQRELNRTRYRRRYTVVAVSTVSVLILAVASAVLVAALWMPVLQIFGTSMEPTLTSGDYVVCLKSSRFKTGDLVAFYVNNKVLVKRVIAHSGDWVDMDEDGNVTVNGVSLAEPYLTQKDKGTCDINLPYQVPEGRIFVMGDNRAVSMDSRSSAVGCVGEELLIGKLILTVWPLSAWGRVGA